MAIKKLFRDGSTKYVVGYKYYFTNDIRGSLKILYLAGGEHFTTRT